MIAESTAGNLHLENIPEQLKSYRHWVCWRSEVRDGEEKPTKVLYTPDTGARASHSDSRTWRPFEDVVAGLDAGGFDGIGFVFSSGDPYAGIDLDGCRNAESGEIEPWAQKIIDRVQAGYIEVSPSGTGVHIIVEGNVRDGGMRKGSIEMYSQWRFFTMTGAVL
jgi:putative DNA primase/helicase